MPVDVELALGKLGLEVRHKGGRLWAEQCPLPEHGAPNPAHRWQNFFVRPDGERRGNYHCYSCKGGGRLVELVSVLLDLDYDEARAWLASIGDAPVMPYVRVRFAPVGPSGRPFRLPSGVEYAPLAKWPGVPADYAVKRGITADQVARWRVGYAYDGRLAHRIVLPTWDGAGRLANYAARTFVDAEVRYLSAGERERPDKSALWGEHLWPGLGERRDLLVFEGALNGLAIERALSDLERRPELGGLSDSRFDHRKAAKIATFRRVVVATDPDEAGDEVALEIAGAMRRRCEVVRLEYPRRGWDASDTPREELAAALAAVLRTGG